MRFLHPHDKQQNELHTPYPHARFVQHPGYTLTDNTATCNTETTRLRKSLHRWWQFI